MTIYEFRKRLVAELEQQAADQARANGASIGRDFGEYRVHAGIHAGLMQAASIVSDFLKRDEEDET